MLKLQIKSKSKSETGSAQTGRTSEENNSCSSICRCDFPHRMFSVAQICTDEAVLRIRSQAQGSCGLVSRHLTSESAEGRVFAPFLSDQPSFLPSAVDGFASTQRCLLQAWDGKHNFQVLEISSVLQGVMNHNVSVARWPRAICMSLEGLLNAFNSTKYRV